MTKSETTNNHAKGGNKNEIAYQNKDIVSKVIAEEFEGKSFAVYGIKVPKIVKVEPTNLPAIEANELRMDNLFLLEDGSYALVDYESEYNRENMFKYLGYVVRASKRLYNKLGYVPKIRMIVIYTADVQRGTTNPVLELNSLRFKVTEAFLSELDHEKIWKAVSSKIEKGKDINSKETMQLIIYPLSFKEKLDKQDAVRKVIELVKKLKDERQKVFILKCLIVFTDKVIRDEDAEEIKEVLMLTKVEKLIYDDAAKKIARKFLEKGEDAETVSECTDLPKDVVIQIMEDIAKEKEQN